MPHSHSSKLKNALRFRPVALQLRPLESAAIRRTLGSKRRLFLSLAIVGALLLHFTYGKPAQAQDAALLSAPGLTAADSAAITGLGLPLDDPQVITDGAAGAHSVYSADFDGDGDLDVVVASRDDGMVRWYRNDGAAAPSFEARAVIDLPGAYMAIPADINQDGHMDIAAVAVSTVQPSSDPTAQLADDAPDAPTDSDGSVIWLENNGAATPEFTRRLVVDNLDYPVSVFAGDLDGDGDIDLLSASRNDNKIQWYRNNGNATPGFEALVINNNAQGAVSVQAGDMDGDGDLDVVSASENDDQIAWYRNDGNGTPNFAREIVRESGSIAPNGIDFAKSVFVIDVDGDADMDIVYASENANEIGWYENDGRSAPRFLQHVVATNLDHIKQVFAADVDLDGDIDLFSASSSDNRVAWYENDGSSAPTFTQHVITDGALGARSVSVGDLDGDGDLDLLTASRNDGRVLWFANLTIHRNARYTAQPQTFIGTQAGVRHLIAADLDEDGDSDLVSIGNDTLLWHESDGGRPPAFTEHLIGTEISGGRWVESGDLDGDGDLDLVAASRNNNTVYWYENRGGGQFSVHTVASGIVSPRAVIAADLNNNGDLDLAVASDDNDSIFWFANNGETPLRFTPYQITDKADYARSVYAADMDGDGDLDLLSADQGSDQIAWYENDGAYWPDFKRRVVVSKNEDEMLPDGSGGLWAPNGAQHVHAADMDGDGDMDILSASEHDNTIAWYESDGATVPSFQVRFIDRGARGVHAVHAGDADNDGDLDVMAAIEYDNEIAWYENDGRRSGPPQFVYHKVYDQALTAHAVNAADVDGDGDLDLLAAARSSNAILWFENLGGQYRMQLVDKQIESLTGGHPNALMTVRALHRGRRGDSNLYVGGISVVLRDSNNRPMTEGQVAAIFGRLAIYADSDNNGVFDVGRDRLISQTQNYGVDERGRMTLALPANSADALLEPGTFKDYFLVGDVNGVCGDTAPDFQLMLLTNAGGFSARDDRPLLPEFARTIAGDNVLIESQGSTLQINEFMADNTQTWEDPREPGEYPDWIEIYNRGPFEVDLSGMYLSDNPSVPTRYRIPDGIKLAGYSYIVFIADGEFTQGPLHTNFGLSRDGESVGLFDRDAMGNQVIDIYTYEAVGPDQSIGRPRNDSEKWETLPMASPGQINVEAPLDKQYFLPMVRIQSGC